MKKVFKEIIFIWVLIANISLLSAAILLPFTGENMWLSIVVLVYSPVALILTERMSIWINH